MADVKLAVICFCVALVAALAGITAGYSMAPAPDKDADVQRCLYSAVGAYPNLPTTQSPLDFVHECKGLSASEKAGLRGMVSRFFESALDKSAKEG